MVKTIKISPLPHVSNPFHLQIAMTPKAVNNKIGKNYERLEWLGDSFYRVLLVYSVMKKYPGQGLHLVNELEPNKKLSRISVNLGLPKMLNTHNYSRYGFRLKADIFESVMGCYAIELVGDYNNHFKRSKEISLFRLEDKCKTWHEVIGWTTELLNVINPGPTFNTKTQKLAKKKAAAYKTLGQSIIKLCVSMILFNANPTINEGKLTILRDKILLKIKKSIQNKKNLNEPEVIKMLKGEKGSTIHYCIGFYIWSSENVKDLDRRVQVVVKWLSTLVIVKGNGLALSETSKPNSSKENKK